LLHSNVDGSLNLLRKFTKKTQPRKTSKQTENSATIITEQINMKATDLADFCCRDEISAGCSCTLPLRMKQRLNAGGSLLADTAAVVGPSVYYITTHMLDNSQLPTKNIASRKNPTETPKR